MEEINSVNMYNYLFLHVTTRDISVSTLFFDNSVGYLVNVCANINFNLGVKHYCFTDRQIFFREISASSRYFHKLCAKEKKELHPFDCGPVCMRIFHCDVELVTTKFENCHPVAKEM